MNRDLTEMEQRFIHRRRDEREKEKINNASLPAGSDMYFYCRYCTKLADKLPEAYWGKPKDKCSECADLHKWKFARGESMEALMELADKKDYQPIPAGSRMVDI